mmetsp:Transcript_4384/g.8641  ORF Transcript_4384/g.8641 Transcript_4384/m.8641 type:complete len:84 (+) Transcript_4384:111-362(+)
MMTSLLCKICFVQLYVICATKSEGNPGAEVNIIDHVKFFSSKLLTTTANLLYQVFESDAPTLETTSGLDITIQNDLLRTGIPK